MRGAGVMLIEKYKNAYGRIDYTVILFYNKKKNVYEDPGGGISDDETLVETASRELYEETSNTFRIKPSKLVHYVNANSFRSYIAHVSYTDYYGNQYPVDNMIYINNSLLIGSRKKTPSHFKETSDMRRFYIIDLVNCGLFYDAPYLVCSDVDGYLLNISPRTKILLSLMITTGLISVASKNVYINVNPMKLNINISYQSKKMKFLNDTTTYFAE